MYHSSTCSEYFAYIHFSRLSNFDWQTLHKHIPSENYQYHQYTQQQVKIILTIPVGRSTRCVIENYFCRCVFGTGHFWYCFFCSWSSECIFSYHKILIITRKIYFLVDLFIHTYFFWDVIMYPKKNMWCDCGGVVTQQPMVLVKSLLFLLIL